MENTRPVLANKGSPSFLICTVPYAKRAPHSEQLEKCHMYWVESRQVACLGILARNCQIFRKHACLS